MTEALHEISELEACPKCGSQLPPQFSTGRVVCGKCGWTNQPKNVLAQSVEKTSEEFVSSSTAAPISTSQKFIDTGAMKKTVGIGVIVLGVVSSISFFSAASQLRNSGEELTQLRSKGGESVAEAYYQEIGRYGLAYSSLVYGLGWGILAVSCGFGGLLITAKE
jgi:ribosomal protein S27AE